MKYYNLMEMASVYSILSLYQNLKYQCQNSLGLEVSMLGNVVRGFSLVQGWHDPEGLHYRKEAACKMPPSILSLRGWLCQPKQSREGAGD
jgi:hypothetical protein